MSKRKPLSSEEMREGIEKLVKGKPFKTDLDRSMYLAGLKLGMKCGPIMEAKENARMRVLIFEYQKAFDPMGETWTDQTTNPSPDPSHDPSPDPSPEPSPEPSPGPCTSS